MLSPSSLEEGLGWYYKIDVARVRAMLRIATTPGPSSKEEGRFVRNVVVPGKAAFERHSSDG